MYTLRASTLFTITIFSTTLSTAAAGPTCPPSNGTSYTSSNGATYTIECGIDHAGGDLSSGSTSTFGACLDLCSNTAGCLDVAYSGVACYMKNKVGAAVSNGVWGGLLVNSSGVAAASVTSTVSSFTTMSSSISISSSTTSATASTSTSSVAVACPASNSTYYNTTSGTTFIVECSIDHAGGDLSMVYTSSLASCMAACGSTTGCLDVSWVPGSPGPCYMKNVLGAALSNGGVWGAKMVNVASSSSPISSVSSVKASSTLTPSSSSTPTASLVTVASSSSSVSQISPSSSFSSSFSSSSTTLSSSSTVVNSTSSPSATLYSSTASSPSSTPTVVSASSSLTSVLSASLAAASASSTTGPSATPGCGSAIPSGLTPGGNSQTFTINTLDGLTRSYLIYIPTNYNINNLTPLHLSFHGNGGYSAKQEGITGFSTASMNPNMIIVYPQGQSNSWQGAPYSAPGVNDIEFTQELIANLAASYCIDKTRIYVSGQSNGGGFVGTLACDPVMSTQIAAFAANSGAFYPGGTDANCVPTAVHVPCSPGRAHVPFLEIHGNADQTISYTGGSHNNECMPDIPTYIQEWASLDGYSGGGNITTSLGNGNMMYQFGQSVNGTLGVLTHIMVNGLGHAWASNFNGFSASPAVMSFLNQWSLNTPL